MLEQTTNYALGARASYLGPEHPDYGKEGLLPEVTDGRWDSYTMTSRWKTKAPYRVVIELPEPRTVSAFVFYTREKNLRSWTYAPRSYKVKVSADGSEWTTVAEAKGPRFRWNIHIFKPVLARYVAMTDISPSPHPKGMVLHEVGVYDLSEIKPVNTLDNPDWWDQHYAFRTRLEEGLMEGSVKGGAVNSRAADLTTLLLHRVGLGEGQEAPPVDPLGVRIVRCTRHEEAVAQYACPTTFIPDARFDLREFAVGRVVWWADSAAEGDSWWVYMNVQKEGGEAKGASQEGPSFEFRVDPEGRSATITSAPGVGDVLVYDDLGLLVARADQSVVELTGLDPLRRYLPVGRRHGRTVAGPWFGVPGAACGVEGLADIPVWNYHRGQPITGSVELTNTLKGDISGTFRAVLADARGAWVTREYPAHVEPGAEASVGLEVPTASVACGDYELRLTLSDDDRTYYAAAADVVIAPARHPALPWGFYGWPAYNRLQAIKYTREVALYNVTVSTAGRGDAMLDECSAWGIDAYPRGPHEGLYPLGPTRVVAWDGTRFQGAWFQRCCPADPEGLKKMARMVKDQAARLKRYGSFRGFSCFDDYAFSPIRKGDTMLWTCYCEHCRKAYRDRYGEEPPQLDGMKWTSPVVPDDDPALRFIVNRCKILGDYVANYEAAKASVDPSLEIGMMMMRNVGVGYGQWPPYHFRPASVFSMYDYVSCSSIMMGYWTLYELGMMGNRNKKSWMLCEAKDVSRSVLEKREVPVPAWVVRSEFWNLLAAGFRVISLFSYGRGDIFRGTATCEEIKRIGAVAKRAGPLFAEVHPKPAKAAIFASFPDFVQPDAPIVWPQAKAKIEKLHLKMLISHIPAEIVSDDEAREGYLGRYDAVVVPNIAYIRQSALDALVQYRKSGGRLLIDDRSAVDIPGAERLPEEGLVTEAAVSTARYFSANTASENVVFREFEVPGGALFVLVNSQAEVSGQLARCRWGRLALVQVEPVKCRFALARRNLACYDLLAGRLLPQDADGSVPISLEPAGGLILACYEHPVECVIMSAGRESARRGEALSVHAEVQAGGKRSGGLHLLDVRVFQPDGTLNREYSKIVLARRGAAVMELEMAVNDQLGTWKIAVAEMASGKEAAVTFELREKKK